MAEYSITLYEYQWVALTMFVTVFICWTAQEILERRFAMSPRIITTKDLHKESAISSTHNPMKHYIMNRRLTKSLDLSGQFRIQTRGTIYLIKAVWCFLLFLTIVIFLSMYPQWFIQHFYYLNPSTAVFAPNLHCAATIFAFYMWETTANRYGRLVWSVLVHHWLTSAAALAMLLGRFSPFATWYAFTAVALAFPVFTALGFRAQFSNKYPDHTRKLFTFSFYWYIATIIMNFGGQIFIVTNSLMYHFNESLSIYYVIIMIFCMMAWLYDDIQLAKALYAFSLQNYEDAQVLSKQCSNPRVGGRSLFGQAVIQDLKANKLLAMTTEEKSALKQDVAIEIPMKQMTESTKTTSATLMKIEKLNSEDLKAIQEASFMNEKDNLKLPVTAKQMAIAMEISMKPLATEDSLTVANTISIARDDDSENEYLFGEKAVDCAKNEQDDNISMI